MIDFGLGLGVNITQYIGDDYYIEKGLPHAEHFKTLAWHADFSIPATDHLRARIAYIDPGVQSVASDIVPDDQYNIKTHRCAPCTPLSHWYGWGSAKGISLGLEWHSRTEPEIEASLGGYVFRGEWRQFVGTVEYINTGSDHYGAGPTVGVGLREGPAELRLDAISLCAGNTCANYPTPIVARYYFMASFTIRPFRKR